MERNSRDNDRCLRSCSRCLARVSERAQSINSREFRLYITLCVQGTHPCHEAKRTGEIRQRNAKTGSC